MWIQCDATFQFPKMPSHCLQGECAAPYSQGEPVLLFTHCSVVISVCCLNSALKTACNDLVVVILECFVKFWDLIFQSTRLREGGGLPFLHCNAWELDTTRFRKFFFSGWPVLDPVFFQDTWY